MKKLLLLISFLGLTLIGFSQIGRFTDLIVDSNLYLPIKDTIFIPKRIGQLTVRPQDSLIYQSISKTIGTKKWKIFSGGSGGSGGTILGNGWGLIKVNDSTYRVDTSLINSRWQSDKVRDSLGALITGNVDTSRTITINGVTYSLGANRTWSVGTLVGADTANLSNRINLKLNISDTAAMLANYRHWLEGYLKSADIAGKLNISDTASMLTNYRHWLQNYLKAADIVGKLNISDTSSMLMNYFNQVGWGLSKSGHIVSADSSKVATIWKIDSLGALIAGSGDGNNYTTGSSFTNNELTLTRNGLSNLTASFDTSRWHTKLYYDLLYIKPSDTAAMLLNYKHWTQGYLKVADIAGKLNISDTASMLANYLNNVGYGLLRTGQVARLDSATVYGYVRSLGVPTLAQVTAAGNNTYDHIIARRFYWTQTQVQGGAQLGYLGDYWSGADYRGTVNFLNTANGNSGILRTINNVTGTRVWDLPDASGTIALTSNIPSAIDTISLSNRINLKVNISDTAAMLLNYRHWTQGYLKAADITGKLNISDTASMLSGYTRKTRLLTINGTAQDLSADRTWNVTFYDSTLMASVKRLKDTAAAIRGDMTGESGSTNSNVGSGYRLAIPNTNNIKTLIAGTNITLDSATANSITINSSGGGSSTPTEQLYGSLYDSTTWNNLSSFTNTSTDATVAANKIVITDGSNTFTEYIGLTPNRCLEKWLFTGAFKVGTKDATSYGFGVGSRSTNSWSAQNLVVKFDMSTGADAGKIKIYTSLGYNLAATSSAALSFSVNDYIELTLERNDGILFATARNKTTGTSAVSVTYTYPLSDLTGNYIRPNTGRLSVYSFGGTFTIDSLAAKNFTIKNADIALVGDSKTEGVNSTTYGSTWAKLLRTDFKSVVNLGGPGDATQDIIDRLDEIISLTPQKVLLNIGRNDIAQSIASATYLANYDTIVARLRRGGIKVYHLTPIYESGAGSVSQVTLYNHVVATYAADSIIDAYNTMQFSGLLASDNVHLSDAGNLELYRIIKKAFKLPGGRDWDGNFIANQNDYTQQANFNMNGLGQLGVLIASSGAISYPATLNTSTGDILKLNTTNAGGGYLSFANSGAVASYIGYGSNIGTGTTTNDIVFRPAGQMVFTTSGAARAMTFVPSTGNLIIGSSSSSSYKFDVSSTASLFERMNTTNATGGYSTFELSGSPQTYLGIGSNHTTGAANGDFSIRTQTNNMYFSGSDGNKKFYFESGKFGVMTAPDSLIKAGSIHITGGARYSGLPTAKRLKQLYIDTDGTLFQADTTVGGVGGAAWGAITGTLSNQTDLQTALNGKLATGLAFLLSDTTAKTWDWADITGKPLDANNYTTGSSFTNNRLTLTRNGLADLTADFDTTRWHTKLYYDGIYGGAVTGTGTQYQIALWNGTSALTGSTQYTWSPNGSYPNLTIGATGAASTSLSLRDPAGTFAHLSTDGGNFQIYGSTTYKTLAFHSSTSESIPLLKLKNTIGVKTADFDARIFLNNQLGLGISEGAINSEGIIGDSTSLATAPNGHNYRAITGYYANAGSTNDFYSTIKIGNDNAGATQGHGANFQAEFIKTGENTADIAYNFVGLRTTVLGGTLNHDYRNYIFDADVRAGAMLNEQTHLRTPKLKGAKTGQNYHVLADSSDYVQLDGKFSVGADSNRVRKFNVDGTARFKNLGTASSDTTTFKPVGINSDGDIIPMVNWPVGTGGSMVYPGAGIAVSTGSAWTTSITDNSANWNTAFGWGNHAGLYFAMTDTAAKTWDWGDITGKPAVLSLTTTGSSGASTYSSATGVLNIPNYGSTGVSWNGIYAVASESVTSTSYTIPISTQYSVFTGSSTGTWTLPSLSGNLGRNVIVKNGTVYDLVIQRAGSDVIYTNASVTSITLTGGQSVALYPASTTWYTYFDGKPGGSGATTFAALTDVSLTSLTTEDFLKWNGTDWINRTPANVRTDLSLNNVTNESKATMFTSPTFTGITTANSIDLGLQSVTTAAGTTTLTSASAHLTIFTGATTQTVVLPNATTLTNGQIYKFTNRSTGEITVQTNGGATLWTIAGTSSSIDLEVTLYDNGTAAGSWDTDYRVGNSATGKASTFNNSLIFSGTDASTLNIGTGGTLGAVAYSKAVKLGSDYTNATTTGTEITGLQVTATGTGLVRFEYYLLVRSSATGTGWKFGVNHTGTATVLSINMTYPSTGTAAATGVGDDVAAVLTGSLYEAAAATTVSTTTPNLGPITGVAAANQSILVKVSGVMNVTVSGDLEIWCGAEAAGTISVMTNSSVIATVL